MGCWIELYPDSTSLGAILGEIRNAGQYKTRITKKTRGELVSPLINAILGEDRTWTEEQCESFFENLLRQYCPTDDLDNLLAVSGYGDEYRNRKTAADRRKHYFDLEVDSETSTVTDPEGLRKREDVSLKIIAEKIQADFSSGKLRNFVFGLFNEVFESIPKLESASEPEQKEHITYDLFFADGDGEGEHWGDSDCGRHAYTKKEINSGILEDSIVFNSIINGEFGDERNFVGAALVDGKETVWYGDNIKVEHGKTYVICLYIHNDNPSGLNAIAEGVRVSFSLPTTGSKSHTIIGYIDSSNAKPHRYWDAVTLYADEDFFIDYEEGSTQYINRGMGVIPLTDDSIIRGGTILGYSQFDGKFPGGHGYDAIVTIKVTVYPSTTITKLKIKARLKGTSRWMDKVYANIGDVVEFQIAYENLAADTVGDVMIRDILPNNMEYLCGSTVLYNSVHQEGVAVIEDDIVASGINIGSYAPHGNAYIRFAAKVADNDMSKGAYQLVNWSSATVNGAVAKDDVSIFVTK